MYPRTPGLIPQSGTTVLDTATLVPLITGDEDMGVQQYLASHPDFPHETTADQFFTEDQFEQILVLCESEVL
jgi:hypothetical protein